MAFFDRVSVMAKNIGDKTTDVIETTKLGAKAKSERNTASLYITKIGEYYYERFVAGGEVDDEIRDAFENAKLHLDAAREAENEANRIKIDGEAQRAAATASVTPAQKVVVCPECKADNAAGTRFCWKCGGKLEGVKPMARKCPSCATAVNYGVRFCPNCGSKIDE